MRRRNTALLVCLLLGAGLFLLVSRRPAPEPAEEGPGAVDASRPGHSAPRAPGAAAPGATAAGPADEPAEAAQLPSADGAFELLLSASGHPVAQGAVRLYLRGPLDPNTGLTEWRLRGGGSSDAQGLVRLPAAPGVYLAVARAPGLAAARVELHRAVGDPLVRTVIELGPGLRLVGRTVSRGGAEPVPQVALTLQPRLFRTRGRGTPEADLPPEELVQAASDAQGQFSLDGLTAGPWLLEARAPGFGRASVDLALPRAQLLTVELLPSAFITGHVVRGGGGPVAGAEVTAVGGRDPVVAVTNEAGAFSLEVEARSWSLSARAGGEAGRLSQPVTVAPGQSVAGLVLRLGPAGQLVGRVVVAHGRGVGGARVDVSPFRHNGDLARAQSAEDGTFSVAGLAPGDYDVEATLEGYQRGSVRGLQLGPGQSFPLTIELHANGSIAGTVRDARGSPVAGALVAADWWSQGAGPRPEARSGAGGRYQLGGLPAGEVELSARAEGVAGAVVQRAFVREGETGSADFTLADDGLVSGRILPGRGGLPERLQVQARRAGQGVGDVVLRPVDASGAFSLRLPVGAWRLAPVVGDAAPVARDSGELVAVEAGARLTRDLQLPDEVPPSAPLVFTVLEPGGAPAVEAQVRLTSGEQGVRFFSLLVTDEQGRATLQRPRGDLPATLDIKAFNEGRTGEAHASRDQEQVLVQLQAGARVEGHLSGAAADLRSKVVAFSGPGLGTVSEVTGDRFTLEQLVPGQVQLTVQTSDGRFGSASVEVRAGEAAAAEIALERAPSVTGRVVDEAGAPLPGATLLVDSTARPDPVGPDGRFTLTGYAPGAHTFAAAVTGRQSGDRRVQLAAGQPVDLGDLVVQQRRVDPGSIGAQLYGDSNRAVVTWLLPGGPAEAAGLMVGDQIVAVDGTPVTSATDARGRVVGPPRTPVQLTFLRNGNRQQLTVVRG